MSVSIVTQTSVLPERDQDFARWQGETSNMVSSFPGFFEQRLMAFAAAQGLTITVCQAPMTELPFEDGQFDHVLSWNVIYHGDETVVRRTLAEVARVLRPGQVITKEFNAQRLNLEVDANGRIVAVRCG